MYKFIKNILVLSMVLTFSGQAFALSAQEVINNFAFNAAKIICSSDVNQNYFFSPYSIITAVSMAYAGAKNDTAVEFENSLGLDLGIHKEFGELVEDIENTKAISSANKVWLLEGLKLKKRYSKLLKDEYKSSLEELDFKNETENSRKKINDWVSKKTNEKIQNLLEKLDPETQMILTNAVYFNAEWNKKFNKRRTSDEKFYVNPEISKNVKMMKQRGDFDYAETEGYKIIKIPYDGKRFSMVAVLPVARFQNDFSGINYEIVKKLLEDLEEYEVDLWLPKFKTEENYELKELFEKLGIKLAFSDFADFSGITKSEKLKIDRIIHKTFIDIDEEKTEAAAATAITMVRVTGLPQMEEKKKAEFHADHPFIYMIIDDFTNTILFMGRQNFSD